MRHYATFNDAAPSRQFEGKLQDLTPIFGRIILKIRNFYLGISVIAIVGCTAPAQHARPPESEKNAVESQASKQTPSSIKNNGMSDMLWMDTDSDNEVNQVTSSPPPQVIIRPNITNLASCAPRASQEAIKEALLPNVAMVFLITKDGNVAQSRIWTGSGNKSLDEETLRSLSKCKFTPLTINEAPIESWVKIRWTWSPKQSIEWMD